MKDWEEKKTEKDAQMKYQRETDRPEMDEAEELDMEHRMKELKKQYEAIPVPEEGVFRMEQAIRAMKKETEAEKMEQAGQTSHQEEAQTGQEPCMEDMQTAGRAQTSRSAVGNHAEQIEKKEYRMREQNTQKKQKRSFWKGAGLTAAAAAVCITILANSSASISMAMEKLPVLGVIVKTVTFRDFQVAEEHYQADVNVPQMSAEDENGSQELQDNVAKINANIQSYTDQFVEEFKQSMEEKGEGYEGLNISYDVVTDNDKLYTIKVSAQQTAGDAMETNRYYHLDKTTGTELTLSSLFRSGSDYTNVISDEIKKQMKEQMAADDSKMYFLDDQDFPEWNFQQIQENQNFYINSDGKLVIAFDETEVAPASMGCPEFVIPTEVIQDMLNPGLSLIK